MSGRLLDSMPYAPAWFDGQPVAGLANGALLEVERGSGLELSAERLDGVLALAPG